jgi:hypothetical protein
MWEEVDEIERLVEKADSMDDSDAEPEIESSDPRNRGKPVRKKRITVADKDTLNMQFKALQARRELLNLSADDEKAAETDAVNLMYVSLTADEFLNVKQAEMFRGADDAAGVFGASGGASKQAPSGEELKGNAAIDELYTTDANGDIVEL